MKHKLSLITCLLFITWNVFGQSSASGEVFSNPVVVDSSSTIMIPVAYDAGLFTSNKLALWGSYYANIIFYNFKTDSSKKLFEKNTYIENFNAYYTSSLYGKPQQKNRTSRWIFYKVKNLDHNKNNRIDSKDPSLLYVSDIYGNNLKCLTNENENIEDIDIFEKQNFAFIKIQRDLNKDGNFDGEDKDYYYVKLDLVSFTFGRKIELKQ